MVQFCNGGPTLKTRREDILKKVEEECLDEETLTQLEWFMNIPKAQREKMCRRRKNVTVGSAGAGVARFLGR